MRNKLAEYAGQRRVYVGRLKLYGVRHLKLPSGEMGRRKRRGTALITWLHDDAGQFLTMHVWVPYAEPFVAAGVERGQSVCFSAIPEVYLRGQQGEPQEEDYCLTDIEAVQVLVGVDYMHPIPEMLGTATSLETRNREWQAGFEAMGNDPDVNNVEYMLFAAQEVVFDGENMVDLLDR